MLSGSTAAVSDPRCLLFAWKPLWLGVNWCHWRKGLWNLLKSFKCQSCVFRSRRHLWPCVFLQHLVLQASEGCWRWFPNGSGVYLHVNKYVKEVERANAYRIVPGEKKLCPPSRECQLELTLPGEWIIPVTKSGSFCSEALCPPASLGPIFCLVYLLFFPSTMYSPWGWGPWDVAFVSFVIPNAILSACSSSS